MKRGITVCAGVATILALAVSSCKKNDDKNDNNSTSASDKTFIRMASMSNFAEIQAGQIAANKAEDTAIANFGEMMVMHHTDAAQQLKTIVSSLNDVDSTMLSDSLDAPHVALKDSLMTLSGVQFDSVYIQSQVRDHVKTISLFQTEASSGNNAKLKQFANDLLPQLQMHLDMADSLTVNP